MTVRVPFISRAPWIEQKYGNVPGVANAIGDERPPDGTSSSAKAVGVELDVTVCSMPSVDCHCTVLPALTVVSTPVAPTRHGITVAPATGTVEELEPLEPYPPHADSTATSEKRKGRTASLIGRFAFRVMPPETAPGPILFRGQARSLSMKTGIGQPFSLG